MEIDEELKSFLQPGPFSVIVASCDSALTPETCRAWGLVVNVEHEAIDLCVGRAPARRMIETLGNNDALAVRISNVTTYQAIQLKGRCIDIGEPGKDDRIRVRVHGDAFVAGLRLVGISEQAARGMLVSDVVRLRFVPDVLFDQTPGPQAGTQR
jgi:hypothetical protein